MELTDQKLKVQAELNKRDRMKKQFKEVVQKIKDENHNRASKMSWLVEHNYQIEALFQQELYNAVNKIIWQLEEIE